MLQVLWHAPDQALRPEMVVDGRTLSRVLGTPAEPLLARLADRCSGVVVCRASPSQKAAIVRMMRAFQAQRMAGQVRGRSFSVVHLRDPVHLGHPVHLAHMGYALP